MWIVLVARVAAACEPVDRPVADAAVALDGLDVDRAAVQLAAARDDLDCGAFVDPAALAGLWLAEGRLAALTGDDGIAILDFEAAHRLTPSLDVKGQGDPIEALYAQALASPADPVSIELASPLSSPWAVAIDGAEVRAWPAQVPRGLHVVQIGDGADRVLFARVVRVEPGAVAQIDHGLPERPPPLPPVPLDVTASGELGVSADFAFGKSQSTYVDGEELAEPAAKLLLPVDVAATVTIGKVWTRLGAQIGPLVGGEFVYGDVDVPGSQAWAWGVDLSAGRTFGAQRLGLLVGARLPSRALLRAVGDLALGDTGLMLEGQAGINAPTQRPIEPALSVGIRYGSPR
jgi:hypothetical protein